jgi:hypothetical protein
MPDRAEVLRQIAHVLRPGGRLVLTDSYEKVALTPIENEIIHRGFQVNAFMNPDQYQALLPALGFQVLELVEVSVSNTYPKVLAATLEKESELSAIYGDDFVAQMKGIAPVVDSLGHGKLGYFLLSAQKVSN